MWESGISGWQADWRPATEQLRRHADALATLVGTRLTGAWSVWIGNDDEWFADMPVVLQFDGSRQLEVCWQKFDDLSISWNTIDLNMTPRAWIDNLSWRPWRHLAFSMNEGQTVTEVAGTTFPWTTTDVEYPHLKPSTTRLTGGLWIATTGVGLHVFNALDENGLNTAHEPDHLLALASLRNRPRRRSGWRIGRSRQQASGEVRGVSRSGRTKGREAGDPLAEAKRPSPQVGPAAPWPALAPDQGMATANGTALPRPNTILESLIGLCSWQWSVLPRQLSASG